MERKRHETNESSLDIVTVVFGLVMKFIVGLLVETKSTVDTGIG